MRELALITLESNKSEDFGNRLFYLCLGYSFDSQTIGHVFINGEMGEEGIVLEDKPDVSLVGHQVCHILFSNVDAATVWPLETGYHAEGRGFATPRGTQQCQKLPRLNMEADLIDCGDLSF
jgi:hypothetical protein